MNEHRHYLLLPADNDILIGDFVGGQIDYDDNVLLLQAKKLKKNSSNVIACFFRSFFFHQFSAC